MIVGLFALLIWSGRLWVKANVQEMEFSIGEIGVAVAVVCGCVHFAPDGGEGAEEMIGE